MNTLFFKYAIEIARTGSISKAAENLYMAQPNLSKAIKELEELVGFQIFVRNSKGVIPTGKGREFLEKARKILDDIHDISHIAGLENTDRQDFSISIPRGSYIAAAFTQFVSGLDKEKEIDVNLQETSSLKTINNILDNQFNMGIIRYQTAYENYFLDFLADKKLHYDQIWEFENLALMSEKHALAQAENILYSDLESSIEIIHGDTIVPYINSGDQMGHNEGNAISALSNVSKRIYLYERGNQFDLLCSIPTIYMWVSPIPEKFLKRYELVQRKCAYPNNKYKDLLIYPEGYSFSALDKKFIDLLFKSKNEVSLKKYT
jgi:DNA-binding transcriptional LysR family regulator